MILNYVAEHSLGLPKSYGPARVRLSFFVREGAAFAATELTRGPWDPDSQHAGPPCALLARELDAVGGLAEARLARVTLEILQAGADRHARRSRPRSCDRGAAWSWSRERSRAAGSRSSGLAGWRIRTTALELDAGAPPERAPPGPDEARVRDFFDTGIDTGYHTAMDVRFLSGAYREPGAAQAWMRMRVPLIEGEEPSPRDRVLVAADSGNGVSAPLDYHRWLFINADLTVSLRREPRGEWVCLDATTWAEPDGTGLSDTALYDEDGRIGRATQTLLVAER